MSSPRLAVGLLLDDSLDRPDGVQQHVLALGAWLTGQGHRVHYVAPSTKREDLANLHHLGSSLSVRYNGNRLGTPLPASARSVRDLLGQEHFDVLHIAMPYSPFLAGRVITHAPPATAVVGTFHILPSSPAVTVGANALGLLQRRQLRRFDEVMAVSEPARRFAASAFGLAAEVVPNPVDVTPLARAAARHVPGPDREGLHVLFLGRLVERKGAAELLEAVAVLRGRATDAPPFRVTVAGSGPLADRLGTLAADRGIRDLVHFPGFVAEADKPALLASADVVALPSTTGESFGISVVEALAAARGVVLAGDNPGYREVMGPLTGQLVDPRDAEGFARTLQRYLGDPDLRLAARDRQRDRAWRFDVDTVGPQVLARYAAAISRRACAGVT